MKWGDVLDVFMPLVLVPLYWLLFQLSPDRAPKAREITFFLVLVAFARDVVWKTIYNLKS